MYIIHNGELYHYGVKGMKWGHRRAQRLANRTERRYARAGRKLGEAQYERSRGEEIYRKHDSNAKTFDKAAREYEKKGQVFRAEASRKAAAALRARGANLKAQRDKAADYLEARSDVLKQKANSYANKKKVDLGKSKLDSILKTSSQKGYQNRQESESFRRELELENKLGSSNYETLNKIRGR